MRKQTLIDGALLVAVATGAMFIARLVDRVEDLEDHSHSEAHDQRRLVDFNHPTSPDAVWSLPQFCPGGEYVCGLRQKVEPYKRSGDDSGMAAVGFYCCPFDAPSRENE